jgi:hypothetical protein
VTPYEDRFSTTRGIGLPPHLVGTRKNFSEMLAASRRQLQSGRVRDICYENFDVQIQTSERLGDELRWLAKMPTLSSI